MTDVAMDTLEPTRVANFRSYIASGTNKESNPTYQNNLRPRDDYVIPRVTAALDNVDFVTSASLGAPYDVLVYPVLQGFNSTSVNSGSNNRLSPFTGFPALAFPGDIDRITTRTVRLLKRGLIGQSDFRPVAVAVRGDELYTCDFKNHQILVFHRHSGNGSYSPPATGSLPVL